MQVRSNEIGGLAPIHNGHITVHQDQLVVTFLSSIFFDVIFYQLECFFAVPGNVTNPISLDITMVLQDDLQSFDVELFVVYDKDSHGRSILLFEIEVQVGLTCGVNLP